MNENIHILLVDDEPEVSAIVEEYLSAQGYRVSIAHDGGGMRRVIAQSPVDLVLLDVKLPQDDGLSLARSLRSERPAIGIIMMTARGETIDRVIGLEMGADDYLTKPFHLRELLARVRSVLRRGAPAAAKIPPANRTRAVFAGWHLDLSARDLFSPDGEEVQLTSGEFDLLVAFITNPNRVLSRNRLSNMTRRREPGPFDRTIDIQIGRLRRKLRDGSQQPHLIKTVRGSGYIFTATVEQYSGADAVAAAPHFKMSA